MTGLREYDNAEEGGGGGRGGGGGGGGGGGAGGGGGTRMVRVDGDDCGMNNVGSITSVLGPTVARQ